MRRRLAILVLGASLAASSPAFADNVEAAKAFDEGRRLRDARDFEKAAAAFERSISAEPSIGAYYNLAFSLDQLGRTRDALDTYRKALKLAKDKGDAREKEVTEAVTRLLDTHNYVTLIVPDDVDRMEGLQVLVDGEAVPRKHLKGEVFRAPAQHEVVVEAPGRTQRRTSVANRQPVTLGVGEREQVAPPPPPPPPREAPDGGWGWQKWTGAGMVAGGVVSLTITGVLFFPYLAERLSLDSEISSKCGNTQCPAGSASRDLARRNNANIQDADDKRPAMILTGALGGLLVGGGLYLLLTAPSHKTEPPPASGAVRVRIAPDLALHRPGLSFLGTF